HALSMDDLDSIVDIQLDRLRQRLAERRLALQGSPGAQRGLASHGYDPIYGARPLRRLIQSAIGDPLGPGLLGGEVAAGDTVEVDLAPDGGALMVGRASI